MMQEEAPEEYREPWNPQWGQYYSCKEGLTWCDMIEAFICEQEDRLDTDWDHKGLALEELEEFRKRLRFAHNQGAKFNLIFGN